MNSIYEKISWNAQHRPHTILYNIGGSNEKFHLVPGGTRNSTYVKVRRIRNRIFDELESKYESKYE